MCRDRRPELAAGLQGGSQWLTLESGFSVAGIQKGSQHSTANLQPLQLLLYLLTGPRYVSVNGIPAARRHAKELLLRVDLARRTAMSVTCAVSQLLSG